MAAQWKVDVDQSRCIASGICAGTAPDHFRLDGDHSTPVKPVTGPDDVVMDAAISCPVEAIILTDTETGEQIPLDD